MTINLIERRDFYKKISKIISFFPMGSVGRLSLGVFVVGAVGEGYR